MVKRIRHRLEWLALCLARLLVPILPRRGLVFLADALGAIWYRLDPKSRAVAMANLDLVYGRDRDPAWKRQIATASFKNIARAALDVFWSQRLDQENHPRWMTLEGFDSLAVLSKQRGGIVVCLHSGSFEWIGIGGGFAGVRGGVLTQSFKNPLLEPFYNSLRAKSGQRIISRVGGMLPILRILKAGGVVGMLVDLTLPTRAPSRIFPVLGTPTNVTCIHAILHKRTGAPIVPAEAIPLPDGRCRVIAHPPLDVSPDMSETEIVRRTWAFFEPRIRERPDLWLWAYKHWRFRDPENPEAAPFYANISSLYTKKLKAERNEDCGTASY